MNRTKRKAAKESWENRKAWRASAAAKEAAKAETIDRIVKDCLTKDTTSIKAALAGTDFSHPLFRKIPVARDRDSRNNPRKPEFDELLHVVSSKAPKLIEPDYIAVLYKMSKMKHIRPAKEWKPKGKGADTLFSSLASHLLASYLMPRFLWTVFFSDNTENFVPFVQFVAAGGSPFDAIKKGLLTVPLTRKMCHEFMTAPSDNTFIRAIRRSEVRVLGGSERLLNAIMASVVGRFIGQADEESFLMIVIDWIIKNPMLDSGQISPILDYVTYRWRQDHSFSMKGRGVLALIRAMDEWHGELARAKIPINHVYSLSGFKAKQYTREVKNSSGATVHEKWTVEEILSGRELAEEGKKQHHCVYSYGHSILTGDVSIWSLRLDNERMITIEVRNKTKSIVQARGLCNRAPTAQEFQFLTKWANDNDLTVSLGRW